MPGWWGKRSHKNNKSEDQHGAAIASPSSSSSSFPTTPVSARRSSCEISTRSFDESPCVAVGAASSRFPCSSSRFLGFESDSGGGGGGAGRECHPLPRPSVSPSSGNGFNLHGGFGLVNGGSVSVSSVSSSGSSCDDTQPPPTTNPPLLDQFAQLGVSRGHEEVKTSLRSRSPCPGARVVVNSTLPHPQMSNSSSPLHPQWGSSRVESPSSKMEDGRSQCHPLPLPPSSPSSPSTVYNAARTSFASDNTIISPSRWKKGRLLGRGTFGHVYLGFNSEKGRLCAIKEVKLISDDQNARECLKQLNQEINLLSQLSHPNIVRYHGSELGEEALSVYLEYVSGGSIHKLLQEYGPFKEPVIQNYTRQILSGLAYLHARNTVHRDIKGANILVDPNGEIKLADFGMAKHITNCTSVLSFKGSPYWMAPEVVMNISGFSLAVDIWSLGCTVLEMATAKPPWSQYEGVAAIFKIGNSKDVPEIPNHLSSSAKSFLRLCLQRDPALRPSAAELLEHPFLSDQSPTRIPIHNVTNEAFPFAHDGSNRLKVLDIHPPRKSISSYEADYSRRPAVPVSRELRENARTITSLPVSPCSSPLRQRGPAYKSCFLSPPHPSYAWAAQSSHNSNEPSLSPTRAQSNFLLDPWHGSALYKAQTSGGSPRSTLL